MEGVYQLAWGSRPLRVIVLNEVRRMERNAIWHLFGAIPENVHYGASCYRWRRSDLSRVMNQLLTTYRMEGFAMPYTVEDFLREDKEERKRELLAEMTLEDRLAGLPPEQILKKLTPEDRLAGLTPEQRLEGLTEEEIQAYLKKKASTSN